MAFLYAQGNHLAGELYKIAPNLAVMKDADLIRPGNPKPAPWRTVLFVDFLVSRGWVSGNSRHCDFLFLTAKGTKVVKGGIHRETKLFRGY